MAVKRVIDIEAKTNAQEAAKDFEKLSASIESTNEEVKDLSSTTKSADGGLKKIGTGIKGIGLAFKAAGIGLIISAFAALKEVFTKNQKVANALGAVFETISIVFNEVTDVIVRVYESVSEATGGFDALGKVMGGLLDLVIAPFKATFFGIKLAIKAVQLAWEQSVFGDNDPKTIKNLRKEIELTRQDLVGVGKDVIKASEQIVDNFVEAVGEVGSFVTETAKGISEISVKAAFEQAKFNVEIQNRAKIAAAQQSVLIEQYDRAAEKLRQVRDEERNTIDERIKANNDLNDVLNKQEKALLKQADLQVQAAKNEYDKNKNIENQIALIEAQANREGVLAQIEGLRSEQKANDLALDREKLELIQAKKDADTELTLAEKRFQAERIEDEQERFEALKQVISEEKNIELDRLQNKIDLYKEGTQARLDAEIEYAQKKQEIDQELIALEDENRKYRLEKDKEANEKSKELEEQKFQAVSNTFNAISDLATLFAGENEKQQERAFKVQKAASTANALIDTYKSATGAYASLSAIPVVGPALGAAAAGAAIAAGLANVKAIQSQNFTASGGSQANVSAPSTPNATQQLASPNFNVVGASGVSQAESLAPVKAYVVSGDVTTAQALDRNRINNATF